MKYIITIIILCSFCEITPNQKAQCTAFEIGYWKGVQARNNYTSVRELKKQFNIDSMWFKKELQYINAIEKNRNHATIMEYNAR